MTRIADRYEHAEQARTSFNDRFWYDCGGYLYDVVDGERGRRPCLPAQPVTGFLAEASGSRPQPVGACAGCRPRAAADPGRPALARAGEPDYKPRYFGDLRARDAAYHQGTVWAWLIGPFVDAWLKVHPDDRQGARSFLEAFAHHLERAALGTISEIFDAERPFTPRGCVAQAWSVAEVLRAWVKTAEPGDAPPRPTRSGSQCLNFHESTIVGNARAAE